VKSRRQSEFLKYVDGKTFSIGLAILSGPEAIGLITPDAVNGHRGPSRTQPNKIATLK
jgi:hypothetical protein